MNVNQVTSEMERLIPGKWTWVVEEVGSNTFKTNFPSKSEMHRMINWGTIQSKDRQAKLVIEERSGGSHFKHAMSKVWVQMTGLPGELRDFNMIWAIGTILGVTKDVDMKFTPEHDRARLQVLVLDLSIIPQSVDVVIGEFVYELHFRIEPEELQDRPEPMDMDDNGMDDQANGEPMKQMRLNTCKQIYTPRKTLKGILQPAANRVTKAHLSMAKKLCTTSRS
jgi:hypothetical protein